MALTGSTLSITVTDPDPYDLGASYALVSAHKKLNEANGNATNPQLDASTSGGFVLPSIGLLDSQLLSSQNEHGDDLECLSQAQGRLRHLQALKDLTQQAQEVLGKLEIISQHLKQTNALRVPALPLEQNKEKNNVADQLNYLSALEKWANKIVALIPPQDKVVLQPASSLGQSTDSLAEPIASPLARAAKKTATDLGDAKELKNSAVSSIGNPLANSRLLLIPSTRSSFSVPRFLVKTAEEKERTRLMRMKREFLEVFSQFFRNNSSVLIERDASLAEIYASNHYLIESYIQVLRSKQSKNPLMQELYEIIRHIDFENTALFSVRKAEFEGWIRKLQKDNDDQLDLRDQERQADVIAAKARAAKLDLEPPMRPAPVPTDEKGLGDSSYDFLNPTGRPTALTDSYIESCNEPPKGVVAIAIGVVSAAAAAATALIVRSDPNQTAPSALMIPPKPPASTGQGSGGLLAAIGTVASTAISAVTGAVGLKDTKHEQPNIDNKRERLNQLLSRALNQKTLIFWHGKRNFGGETPRNTALKVPQTIAALMNKVSLEASKKNYGSIKFSPELLNQIDKYLIEALYPVSRSTCCCFFKTDSEVKRIRQELMKQVAVEPCSRDSETHRFYVLLSEVIRILRREEDPRYEQRVWGEKPYPTQANTFDEACNNLSNWLLANQFPAVQMRVNDNK